MNDNQGNPAPEPMFGGAGQQNDGGVTPGGAGGQDGLGQGQNNLDLEQGDGAEGDQGGAQTTPPTGQPGGAQPLQMSPEQLKALIDGVKPGQGTAPANETPMTEEEFAQRFNVVKVTEQDLTNILNNELPIAQRLESLQKLLHNTARMAVTMSSYASAMERQKLEQAMAPALTYAQQAQEAKLAEEFFTSNEDLRPYESILLLCRDQLVREGRKFNTKQEAFKTIREMAVGIINKLPPSSDGQVNPRPVQRPASARQGMSTVSTGGQIGVGRGQQSGGPIEDLFGPPPK